MYSGNTLAPLYKSALQEANLLASCWAQLFLTPTEPASHSTTANPDSLWLRLTKTVTRSNGLWHLHFICSQEHFIEMATPPFSKSLFLIFLDTTLPWFSSCWLSYIFTASSTVFFFTKPVTLSSLLDISSYHSVLTFQAISFYFFPTACFLLLRNNGFTILY